MHFGARKLIFPGLGLIAAGLALFAMTPAGGTYLSYVSPVTLLIGTSAGLCFPAPMTLAMSSATLQGGGLAFWIAFSLVVAAIAVAATVLRPQRPAAAAPQAPAGRT